MARILYVPYSGTRVSRRWHRVLKAADKAGVRFDITSGHRTLREQAVLYRRNMIRPGVPKPGRPLTAFPSPVAPHIRTGRHAHALDVNALDGGEDRLQRWLQGKGLHPTNPVRGEAWHLELPARELRRFARQLYKQEKLIRQARRRKARQRTRARERKAAVDFLVAEEGIVLHAYNDPAGHATFGVGHLIHLGGVTPEDERKWGSRANPKTRAFALAVFRKDLKSYEATVDEAVRVPLNWHERAALVSLCFNIGRAGFRDSTVVRELNRGNRQKAADAIRLWDKPPVLKPRRERERRLFLTGK